MHRLIVLLVCIFSNSQECFNITQPSRINQDFPDIFLIPQSQCNKSKGATECSQMGGRKIGDCQCACKMKNDKGFLYKSTFGGFGGGKWKCVNNSLLRKQAGCLKSANVSSNTLDIFTVSNSICIRESQLEANSSYLNCDDKSFNGSRFFHKLSSIQFISESDIPEPRLDGMIIRLSVECYKYSSTSCLLLKLEGYQNCTEPPPSTSSSSTSSISSSIATMVPAVTAYSTYCVNACKTLPISPSKLHIMIIWVLLGVTILVVIVVALVLIIKSRRITRRKLMIRQRFVTQMSALRENEYDDIVIDQSRHDDGYLYPIDNAPPDKRYEKKLDSKEIGDNAERVHMEESGPTVIDAEENKSTNRHSEPPGEIKSRARKMNSALQSPSCNAPSKRYEGSITESDSIDYSTNNKSKEEPFYHSLEDPTAFGTYKNTSETRRDTLPNQGCVSVGTNQRNNDYYDEVGQDIIENVPQKDHNYQELGIDGQQPSHVYQSLSIVKKKSKGKWT